MLWTLQNHKTRVAMKACAGEGLEGTSLLWMRDLGLSLGRSSEKEKNP